jgi:hypothetical protein
MAALFCEPCLKLDDNFGALAQAKLPVGIDESAFLAGGNGELMCGAVGCGKSSWQISETLRLRVRELNHVKCACGQWKIIH